MFKILSSNLHNNYSFDDAIFDRLGKVINLSFETNAWIFDKSKKEKGVVIAIIVTDEQTDHLELKDRIIGGRNLH